MTVRNSYPAGPLAVKSQTDATVALHESGHCAAAVALGIRLNGATMIPAKGQYRAKVFMDLDNIPATTDIIVSLAGGLATELCGVPSDWRNDWQAIQKRLREVLRPAAVWAHGVARCESILIPRLGAVQRLATVLLQRRELTGAEVKTFLERC